MRPDAQRGVGPVLQAGRMAEAVIAAIRELNRGARIVDRGAYVRVLVPGRCFVTRESIQRHARDSFVLPSDLEAIMTSFQGRFSMTDDAACWELQGERGSAK